MAKYTTANLLAAIERRSFSPASQRTFTPAEILSLADEVTQTYILPSILAAKEEFFVSYTDYPIVDGQAAYDLPARAVGMIAREVKIGSDNSFWNLARTEIDRIGRVIDNGLPTAFYMQGNQVVLYPTPNSSDRFLRIYYYLRPGQLVDGSLTATIETINPEFNQVILNTVDPSWADGDSFDFIKKDGAHDYRGASYVATVVSGTTLEFSSLPEGLQVGDLVAFENTSSLVQLPPDYRPVLAMLVAAEILTSQNQASGPSTFEKGMYMLQVAQELITPRTLGNVQVIMPDWY